MFYMEEISEMPILEIVEDFEKKNLLIKLLAAKSRALNEGRILLSNNSPGRTFTGLAVYLAGLLDECCKTSINESYRFGTLDCYDESLKNINLNCRMVTELIQQFVSDALLTTVIVTNERVALKEAEKAQWGKLLEMAKLISKYDKTKREEEASFYKSIAEAKKRLSEDFAKFFQPT